MRANIGDMFHKKGDKKVWFVVSGMAGDEVKRVDWKWPEYPFEPLEATAEYPGLLEAIDQCETVPR
jgi:hypothetical protein